MQFHQNGFELGDPNLQGIRLPVQDPRSLSEVDVLIVGCGPAGLTLAAYLSQFPEIKTRIVEKRSGPLQVGQADGIACRTMEMFEAFGFAERVLKEAYWVNETTFWRPSEANSRHIARSGRVPDVEEGLSHMPHVILNQARVHDFYLEHMALRGLVPSYSRKLLSLVRDATDAHAYPVEARFERQDLGHEGEVETVRAKYVVGCDGARSMVRQSMGRRLAGDSANQAWGVMDVLCTTDFPDIRYKSLIQSDGEGSIVLIPREGGYMVRMYVELDKLAANERVAAKNLTVDKLIGAAQRILQPYTLDVKQVAWWSVYEIGQRLCDKFDDVQPEEIAHKLPRIFIAGDACHTHSPKAGQGMNVSMQDAFNMGWKLAGVLQGQYPARLLHTYSAERQAVAKELIDFDREWAKLLSAPLRKAGDPAGAGADPADVQRYFVQHGRYTAGTATRYHHSAPTSEAPIVSLTGTLEHQHLATGFVIGTRLHSAPVVRVGDGRVMQLGKCLAADGRWRIIVFAPQGDNGQAGGAVRTACEWLMRDAASPLKTLKILKTLGEVTADIDAVVDVRAVFQTSHQDLAMAQLPQLLFPAKGKLGLNDFEKAFSAAPGQDIYSLRGINRQAGCMVVVRPDQYVAQVLPLSALSEVGGYFDTFVQRG